jgi:hypothetical protein
VALVLKCEQAADCAKRCGCTVLCALALSGAVAVVCLPQGDLLSDVGASIGGLVQQAQQGAQQLGDALKAGKIVSWAALAAVISGLG